MLGAGFIVVDRKPRPCVCVWCFGMTTNEKTCKKFQIKIGRTKIYSVQHKSNTNQTWSPKNQPRPAPTYLSFRYSDHPPYKIVSLYLFFSEIVPTYKMYLILFLLQLFSFLIPFFLSFLSLSRLESS